MTLDQTTVVDYIVTTRDSSRVELIIFDAFDWSNADVHLQMLVKKLDLYLTFIESGEVLTCGHEMPAEPVFVIGVRYLYPVPLVIGPAIAELTTALAESGITLEFRTAEPN